MKHIDAITWRELFWPRDSETQDVVDLLTHIASGVSNIPFVYEARGKRGRVRFFVGTEYKHMSVLMAIFRSHGDVRFAETTMSARPYVDVAERLKITKQILPLRTDQTDMVIQAGLAVLARCRGEEQTVLQIIVGPGHNPAVVPPHIPDPHASLLTAMFGAVDDASTDSRNRVKEKLSCPNLEVCIRLGASGGKAMERALGLLSVFRALQSPGVNILSVAENPDNLNYTKPPLHSPLRLSVKELAAFMLLPTGGATKLPGIVGLHPRQLPPPAWYRNPRPASDRTFAVSLDNRHRLSIPARDSLFHTAITGPTGVGKTTVMQHLLLSDAYAGRSILYLDPKGETDNILARLPEYRVNETVILDASAASPVGINILAYRGQRPGQIADTVLAVLKELYKDSWGVFTQDVLSAALHTLVRLKGANLLWLYPLLTDEDFRNRATAGIRNDIGLAPFWQMFEQLNDPERRKMLAPIQNKLRQLLLHPELRNTFGQSAPRFDLMDLFTKRRIVLVPLNKSVNGAAGRLIGSVVIGLLWNMALSRAALPEDRRHIVSVYIDELYDYVASISASFSDTLAQARSLGVGLTVAYQFREQLDKSVRLGIDANARNKICFSLAPEDARTMAAFAPGLTPDDFTALPKYHVYAQFYQGGHSTGWVSGRTLPMTRPLRNPAELKRKVAALYGKPGKEVEREYAELLVACRVNEPETGSAPVGRRAKA